MQKSSQSSQNKTAFSPKPASDKNQKVSKLDDVKDEFISIVSHELRTPMSTIKGYLNMLLAGDAGPVSPQVRDILTEMLLAIEREIRLVNGMLDISRLEAGRMQFVIREDVDIVEQARLLLQSLIRAASEKKLSLIFEAPTQPLPKVQADTDKLVQVLINLVGNAMKFTKKGSITVSFSKEGDFIKTCVADSGPGIPSDKREHLFEKFSQASTKETRVSGGSGLGLYISKVIIEKMGGRIWLAESSPDMGSKFCFSLPISDTPSAKEVAKELRVEENE
jgi:signal transduction histidine kinase